MRALVLTCLALGMTVAASAADNATSAKLHFDLSRPEIAAFIEARVKQGENREKLLATLTAAEPQPKIIEAMTRPAEQALQWWEYRARFLTDERIDAGVKLWREQRELLESCARTTRVSPQYILGILGVETYFGRITGRYRVIDALSTLAFDYPARAPYFQSELAEFLQLAREEKLDPLQPLGSYAGAMGVAQFMPSSYRRYAVNADGLPHRDLWTEWGDIFSSVGNYLARHGWQYGGPVLADASYTGAGDPRLPDRIELSGTLAMLQAQGIQTGFGGFGDTPALLVAAPLADRASYRIGFNNFYVITRYNRSPLYAMAVNDLAEAIATRYARSVAPP